DLIGRWIGYLLRGQYRHTDILQTPPLRGELVWGLAAHYSIGIVLTLVYLGLLVVAHATPTVLSAILYGTATTVFPWFLMFPSQGMGWLGRDAPGDGHLARISLFNHIIFGLGIALWMAVMRPICNAAGGAPVARTAALRRPSVSGPAQLERSVAEGA